MARKIILLLLLFIVFMIFTAAYNIYLNNIDAPWPDNQKIDSALIKSIKWMQTNQSTIESDHKPGPWWMLKEASNISDKPELAEIYTHYKITYLDKQPPNIWTPYFEPNFKPKAPDILEIMDLDKYQIFFVYALTCGNDLGSLPLVKKQGNADFCSPYFLHPRCVTHQQMGVRLLQRTNCGNQEKLASLSSELVNIIHSQLTWDFRVGDLYLQRNLILAESSRVDLIKPIWIQRILEAQNSDGSWDDVYSIPGLGENSEKSTFHTTAQGVWLLSLLQQHGNDEVSTLGTANN
jgi:hypothetical protein